MLFNEDKRVKLPVPFLRDSTVLFVDSLPGTFHTFIEDNKTWLTVRFREAGYTFLFLPDMVGSLSSEMLQYLFPGQKDIIPVEDLYRNIRETARLGDKAGFLYRQDGLTYFRVMPESQGRIAILAIDGFVSFLTERRENELYEPKGDIRFRESKRYIPDRRDQGPL